MTDHMGRTLADAIKAAGKLKDELPHIVQVYPSDHDTIIMAAEIERLREAGNDLGFYAGHEDACDCVKGWAKGPCNCGYTEAWQAWHSLAGKAEQ